MKYVCFFMLTTVCCLCFTAASYAESGLKEAISAGEAHLSFRLRYEDVEQDTPSGNSEADAITLRTRLNYTTGAFHGLTALIEVDDVTGPGDVDYRTWPGDTNNAGAAVIADPQGTEVNQVWLNYKMGQSNITWGRQRIALDNQRYIGTVGWRQNEQTYDGLSIVSNSLKDTTISTGFISNVNRIFGEAIVAGDVEHNSYYVNVNYTGLSFAALSAYAYLLDASDSIRAFDSWDSNTYGVRFAGQHTLNKLLLACTLEYAYQSDASDNPRSYDANYLLLEGAITRGHITVKAGQEVLGADNSNGFFITPFATLHKFQGWTDKFLNQGKGNIEGGIVDRYVSVGSQVAGINFTAVYHDFAADDKNVTGNRDLGSEWGILAVRQFNTANGTFGLTLKYASYTEGDWRNDDTDKLWLMATAQF